MLVACVILLKKLTEEIAELKERIKVLEDRLGQNSANSNKPPSTDWPAKQRSLRGKSGKPPGGQKGHKGYNLKMVEVADPILQSTRYLPAASVVVLLKI